jgi:hypothetical protein
MMDPIVFGCFMALAIILPVYGYREFIAQWLLELVEKIDKLGEDSEKTS